MQYRTLGRTGIQISAISFGAGPVSTLMVGQDGPRQQTVVEHALRRGINWFDTAATYGNGKSEESLGAALATSPLAEKAHVATKVRLLGDDLKDIRGAVRRSVEQSLKRLGLPRVTLLQLHNSITPRREDEPTSITPADVLERSGVLEAFQELRAEGRTRHLGLTGIGHAPSLIEVISSGEFDTVQTPYHLLNPSAGQAMPADFAETNYGNLIAACARQSMGVLAIRVFAGGALLGNPPSPHTFKTPFFPLSLYERDQERAARLQGALGPARPLSREAIRFALSHSHIHSALIGFAETSQIDEAIEAMELGDLTASEQETLSIRESNARPATSPSRW